MAEELRVEASVRYLGEVQAFLDDHLDDWGCSLKYKLAIELAVEEVFVNIASYAYTPATGDVVVECRREEPPDGAAPMAVIRFTDHGRPYDPLKREAPDVTLPAEERQIGGLGIFLVRRKMDDVSYEFRDGCNILTLKKAL